MLAKIFSVKTWGGLPSPRPRSELPAVLYIFSREPCLHIERNKKMPMKTCAVCGTSFGTNRGNRKYCSKQCKGKANRASRKMKEGKA